MQVSVERIGGALGAEVASFDAKTVYPEDTYAQIREALAEHCVLVFRDQVITDLEAVTFVDRIGVTFEQWNITPEFLSPDTKKVYCLTSRVGGSRYAGSTWHADYAFTDQPADISCMQMRKLPSVGGDTGFANMYAAYDALSEQMKTLIADLTAVFDNSRRHRLQYSMENAPISKARMERVPIARHPLVITHPLTQRKALYCSEALVDTIVELPPMESKSIVDFLHNHVDQHQFHYRHAWRENDLVLLDNRCTNHCAIGDYDLDEMREGIVLCAHTEPSPFRGASNDADQG